MVMVSDDPDQLIDALLAHEATAGPAWSSGETA
jgi:hypothetical protein